MDAELFRTLRAFAERQPTDALRAEQALAELLGDADLDQLRLAHVDTHLLRALEQGGAGALHDARAALGAFLTFAGRDDAAGRCADPVWDDAERTVAADPGALPSVVAALQDNPLFPPPLWHFQFRPDRRGPIESGAELAVADALEEAVTAGRLDPAQPGWRDAQRSIAAEVLDQPYGEHDSLRAAIERERLIAWRQSRSLERRALIEEVAGELEQPPAWRDELAAAIAPFALLIDLVSDGAPARDGLVDRGVVAALSEHAGWKPPSRLRRSQHGSVGDVACLTAAMAGLIQFQGEQVIATTFGRAVALDPRSLWEHLCRWGVPVQPGSLEVLLLLCASQPEWTASRLVAAAEPVITAEGWTVVDHPDGSTGPAPRSAVYEQLHGDIDVLARTGQALQFLAVSGTKLLNLRLRVTARETLLGVLRGAATGPGVGLIVPRE